MGSYIKAPKFTQRMTSIKRLVRMVPTPHTFPCQALKTCLLALPLSLFLSPTLALADDNYDTLISVTAGAALLDTPADIAAQARGVLKAGEEAVISSGLTARLLKANYKAGQSFKKGALFAEFDCSQLEAQAKALYEAHTTFSLHYQNQGHLYRAGAAGELDVTIARSEMKQASAERDAIRAQLKHCRVYAPYSGIIVEKHVAAYETPAQNAPLYTIQQTTALEISVIIPSNWLRWVDKGTKFTFTVDETGAELGGKITRIGAAVDPVSQTIDVTGQTTGPTGRSLPGMSGIATFEKADGS